MSDLNRDRRNDLFAAIERAGGATNEFEVVDDGLLHNPSNATATLRLRTVAMGGRSSMWEVRVWPYLRPDGTLGETELRCMSEWPKFLEEIVPTWVAAATLEAQPDLWELARRGRRFASARVSPRASDATFQTTEKSEVLAALVELDTYLRTTTSLDAGQATRLEEKIDALTTSVETLGKVPWRDMFVGSVMSWALSEGLSELALPGIAAGARHLSTVYKGVLETTS